MSKADQLGIKSAGNAITNLWDKANSQLDKEELAWFASMAEVACDEMQNLSNTLMNVGCLVGADGNTGALQDKEGVSALLFGLSHQLEVIKALVSVSDWSNYKLLSEYEKTNAHKKTA